MLSALSHTGPRPNTVTFSVLSAVLLISSRAQTAGGSNRAATDPRQGVLQQLERRYFGYDATVFVSSANFHNRSTVSFGHGFGLSASKYFWIAERLASAGHIVVLPHTAGAPNSKALALAAAAGAAGAFNESQDATSPLYGRASGKWASCGHSLGGGTSFLAADPSILAGRYDPPSSIFTVSAGTWTIPGAQASAPRVGNETPALLFTATEDCVDPPEKNSVPLFGELASGCKAVVSVVGGCHCQYAAASLGCAVTERLCGARPNVTRAEQQDVTAELATAWFQFVDGAAPFRAFQGALKGAVEQGKVLVMHSDWSRCANHEARVQSFDGTLSLEKGPGVFFL